jgi:glycopeptide antibiotics resistance protein
MTALYWGTPLHAFTVVVRKLLLFSMFGSVMALMQPAGSRTHWKLGCSLLVLGLPLGIELLQLWLPPHVPDITDVALGTVGIAVGFVLTNRAR